MTSLSSGLLRLGPRAALHSYTQPEALAAALAGDVAEALAAGLRSRGCASLVVSGGRSPIAFFERLAECDLDWQRIAVGLVDERWVPASSPESNEGLVRRHLLRGRAQRAQLVPLVGDEPTPEEGLVAAERRVASLPRPFDVVVLGMGSDGHTASWFAEAPETSAAMNPCSVHRLAAVRPRSAPHPRITMTLPEVLGSRLIALQIQGVAKANVLARAAETADESQWPVAAILTQSSVHVRIYYADEQAEHPAGEER